LGFISFSPIYGSEQDFYGKINSEMVQQFKGEVREIGATNPGIGIGGDGNIALETQKLVKSYRL
jgi:hypothetical protein